MYIFGTENKNMMKRTIVLTSLLVFLASSAFSQVKSYATTGLEVIFSMADINDNGVDASSTLRFEPVINIETMYNADLSSKFGLFSGLAIRNVGYIYDNYTDPSNEATYKKKFRSYNIGVPLGIKIGNLNGMFLYGGYEVELAWLYKERTYESGDKIGTTKGWFSDRQNLFQHGFLVGIQFPYGANVKFKYYLSEFHNQNFEANGVKPYAGLNSNIWYISLNFMLFRNLDFYME
jgi:hypothetical protein